MSHLTYLTFFGWNSIVRASEVPRRIAVDYWRGDYHSGSRLLNMTSGQASRVNVKILRFISRREKENNNNYIETNKFLFFFSRRTGSAQISVWVARRTAWLQTSTAKLSSEERAHHQEKCCGGRTYDGWCVCDTWCHCFFTYSTLFFKMDISFFRIFASRQLVFVLYFKL